MNHRQPTVPDERAWTTLADAKVARILMSVDLPSTLRLRRLSWAVAAILCLAVTPALATESARDEAHAKAEVAAKLLESGDFAAALGGFESAYAAYPSPKLFYNIGLAQKGMGRPALAFLAFERFLKDAPDASPRHLEHARQELERLSKRVAFVVIASDVAEAEVSVDGTSLGEVAFPRRVPVETGPHEVTVRASTRSKTLGLTAVAGESVNLTMNVASSGELVRASLQPGPLTTSQAMRAGPNGVRTEPVGLESRRTAGDSGRRAWLPVAKWASLGTAVAALGAGVYFNVRSVSKRDEFDNVGSNATSSTGRCGTMGDVVVGPSNCQGLADDFKSSKRNATIGYAVGGGFAVATALLFVLGWEEPVASSAVLPGTAISPMGMTYVTRF
jgi:hypothetical protein